MSSQRFVTDVGKLARLGFQDAASARTRLESLGELDQEVLTGVTSVADPDLALAALVRLADATRERDELLESLTYDELFRARLLAVLGASDALGQHLAHHPEHWHDLGSARVPHSPSTAADLRRELLVAVGADPDQVEPEASGSGKAPDLLRVGYRRALLGLVARDLTAGPPVDEVAAELADLAGATLEAALAIARGMLGSRAREARLCVVAMGKCGGRELNYVSDVDVIFVAEAAGGAAEDSALRVATQLASAAMRVCSDYTGEGTIWPVDAGLRPEGKAGPLVRTLNSHLGYYQRWAKTWEFQALLKARPVAGDAQLGERYMQAISPLVWQASERDGFVNDVQAMRRRVLDTIPGDQADRQLKLGPGGLRDVEFAVQLLQLVHGRTDPSLRSANTLVALDSLTAGGYVGREDGATMATAYRFLRSLEHRIQLWQLRRTHVVPDSADAMRRLGRSLGFTREPVEELTREWRRHAREVRRLHEKLFYRPLLTAVARLPGDDVRLSTQAAQERLTALGYLDPSAALRHIESLTEGLSRRAAIQRTLLPAMLEWFADAPDPDAGLLAFRQVSDSLGSTHWYLRLLRDEGLVAARMARVLSSSRYATDLLMRAPEAVAMLSNDEDLLPRTREQLESEMTTAAQRYDVPVAAAQAVRAVRRRELLRVSMSDLLDLVDVEDVTDALSDIAMSTLTVGLQVAVRATEAQRGQPLPTRLAVIAMGRLGGHELSFGSDADVMFVHAPLPGVADQEATEAATMVVNELQRLLGSAGTDPPLQIDVDLRPEGRQGPLVRSLASYAAYYERWSKPWEAQALIRAEPACGDAGLQTDFVRLVDPLRFPAGGLTPDSVAEIRRVKARVDAERLPRAADPATHTKLGPGGLADVEWTVQLLQLRHGDAVPALRTTRTLAALRAAEAAGLVSAGDALVLSEAWRLATRVRNAIVLVRGRPSDSLPRAVRERAGVAYVCGYGAGEAERLVDDYRRTTRRASAVIDRLFWA